MASVLLILASGVSCGSQNIKRLQVHEDIYPFGPPAPDLDAVARRRASQECSGDPSLDSIEITVILEELSFENVGDRTELERQTSTIDC